MKAFTCAFKEFIFYSEGQRFFTKVKPDIVQHSSLSIQVKGDLHFLLIGSIFGQGHRNSFQVIPS